MTSNVDTAGWIHTARRLVIVTAAYNLLEAGVAIWSAWAAGSVALAGFGLDSIIECSAAAALILRLRVNTHDGSFQHVEALDIRVRQFVGVTFLFLAAYVTIQSIWILARRLEPEESPVGIALAILSLVIMPVIAFGKIRAARAIESPALLAEAKETLACAYLSFTLLAGLLANAALGWWWADPAAACLMVPWLVGEARKAMREDVDQ